MLEYVCAMICGQFRISRERGCAAPERFHRRLELLIYVYQELG